LIVCRLHQLDFLLVFCLIIYVIPKSLYNEVSALARKEQIYVRIEELLSYIYFNDLVNK